MTKTKVFQSGGDPPSIRRSFAAWLKAEEIPVVYEYRVTRAEKVGTRIVKLHLEHAPPDAFGVPAPKGDGGPAKTVEAKVFIDASYEGDLLPAAGVKYTFGRESRDTFQEEPAGVGPPTNWRPVDPYVEPGKPESGLLPLVDADHGKPLGAGDDYTQAYNFRFYVTDNPEHRAEITPPEGYDPKQFELVGRYVEYIMQWAGGDVAKFTPRLASILPGWRNSGEYNYQRTSLVTMAPLGVSRFYQDGDWPTRSRVWRGHIDYLRGLHHFLSTDARVPEAFRKQTAAIGLDKRMHPDTHGWPHQLYVRISRRMKGPYVLTHADVLNKTTVDDSVGLALYGVDTYPARRYAVRDPETGAMGTATEGNMFLGGSKGTGRPYPIPYRSITPQADECTNLIVPVCFSASYIAYASARMEPVFCVLGESAAGAAAQAIKGAQGDTPIDVQAVDYAALKSRLVERGQVLSWPVE
ncbi:MAG: FAD-dependent oxidoreductase [Pirellulales bacterium]